MKKDPLGRESSVYVGTKTKLSEDDSFSDGMIKENEKNQVVSQSCVTSMWFHFVSTKLLHCDIMLRNFVVW